MDDELEENATTLIFKLSKKLTQKEGVRFPHFSLAVKCDRIMLLLYRYFKIKQQSVEGSCDGLPGSFVRKVVLVACHQQAAGLPRCSQLLLAAP